MEMWIFLKQIIESFDFDENQRTQEMFWMTKVVEKKMAWGVVILIGKPHCDAHGADECHP